MHIRPDTRSFARALQIAQKDNLASRVRRLVYHATIVENHDEEMSNPLSDYGVESIDHIDFVEDIPEWYREVIEAKIAYVENNQECYWEAIKAQGAFAELDEPEELSRLTSRLNNLESIATVRDVSGPIGGYVKHPTGLRATDFIEGRSFASLFEATASLSIKRLHGELVPWDFFADVNALPDTTLRLSGLRELSLDLHQMGLENCSDQRGTLQAVRIFLSHCSNLEALSIDFDEFPYGSESKFLECVSRATLYKCRYPRLARLTLQGLVTYEDKFIRFLKKHSSTLEDLMLADLMLVQSSNEDDPLSSESATSITGEKYSSSIGSVVSVFQKIHDVCYLKRVRLMRHFTNNFDEAWDFHEPISEGLVPRIRRFLCRQGPSPFPPLAEYLQMQKDSMKDRDSSVHNRDGPDPAAKQFCDDSCGWEPNLIRW
ncbi:hypothetical protein LTR99_009425 [Exophiala xenobiotica]|uniref:Uncharacterized protein n=1 Tax=Vermiconidia calcicola TaxID=1690605 RepID=A0AAV9PZJ1_9PEZI|nr:hypothetical protein LTR92_002252 [Exophiala xenobiotica]KAK5530900.1 hypothetical protein LTR25_008757 [Vermiconidia calcicola]KAK5544392.1 hypothetical protein LTR23_004480 [Chaetothyriales sp. CCFEE 6169]KAK5269017.1 hypothetical protein LTR96_005801 [Exophiala xenobiotica]KAK5294619.1 hypothetical protein LTR99_009425 [Exophiala xenobiotica]